MRKAKWLLLVLVFVLSMFLTACSAGFQEGTKETDTAENADDGEAVVNFLNADGIPSMDPSMVEDEYGIQFTGATMEGLYRLGQDGQPVEGMAIDHKVSEDALTWTFTLREDAVWSNGDPVTAEDFVYAWQRAVNPRTGSEYGPYMMNGVIKNAAAVNNDEIPVDKLGVRAEDEHTLVVDLEKPIPYFESLVTFPTFFPLKQQFVEEQGKDFATSTDTLLFNGPYLLKGWDSLSETWELVKNPQYWDAETVQLDRITHRVLKEVQPGIDLYLSGKVDRTSLGAEYVDQYSTHDDYTVTPETSIYYLKLNQTRSEALANENIRKAISMAFNKQAAVDEILNNGSIAANGFVPEAFTTHPETGETFREINGDLVTYDVEAAKEYWQQGLEELGTDTVELEYLGGDAEGGMLLDEYIVNQLETNLEGLTIKLKSVPFEQKLDLDSAMDYDIQASGWGPDYLDPNTWLNLWVTDGPNNRMGYSNPDYDALIEQANGELARKPAERYEAFLAAERILFEDAALAPVFQKARAQLISPEIQGVISNAFGPTYEYKWASVTE